MSCHRGNCLNIIVGCIVLIRGHFAGGILSGTFCQGCFLGDNFSGEF